MSVSVAWISLWAFPHNKIRFWFYDGKSKQFVEHYQYTESDLREYEYSGEDECTDCDTVDTNEYN